MRNIGWARYSDEVAVIVLESASEGLTILLGRVLSNPREGTLYYDHSAVDISGSSWSLALT